MIYTKDGTPLGEALADARLSAVAPVPRHYFLRDQSVDYPNRASDGRYFRVVKDRNGDLIRHYREFHVHRPGRRSQLLAYVRQHGSQRKAAKALGIALSTLQRRIAVA